MCVKGSGREGEVSKRGARGVNVLSSEILSAWWTHSAWAELWNAAFRYGSSSASVCHCSSEAPGQALAIQCCCAVRAGRLSANRFAAQAKMRLSYSSLSLHRPDIIHADGNKLVLSMETASQHKWQIEENQASRALLLIKLFLEQSASPSRVCVLHSNQKFLANQSVVRLVMARCYAKLSVCVKSNATNLRMEILKTPLKNVPWANN